MNNDQPARQSKGERTKQRLREGVRNLLANHDFDEVAIEDIVKETGIPIGSIYFHFKSKDRLMHAVAEESFDAFYGYFEKLDEEELFAAVFLVCWRSVQQYLNRRGMVQLVAWHNRTVQQELPWIAKRRALLERLAAKIPEAAAERDDAEQNLRLMDMLFRGMSRMIRQLDLPRGIEHEAEAADIALDLASTWYLAVTGRQVDEAETCAVRDRILAQTKQLIRPLPLPEI